MADISSLFGELTKNVQIRIDKASELQKRLFDEVLYTKFLDDFDFCVDNVVFKNE